MVMQKKVTVLDSGWEWRLVATSKALAPSEICENLTKWQTARHCPSEIHLELLSRELIPDYMVGQNERDIQWVGKTDWEYRCSFETPHEQNEHLDMVFEGLDTFATISLNGVHLVKSDNMFIPIRLDVSKGSLKRPGEQNDLVILFESAERKGSELEKDWGERTSLMRDKKRMNMRKAQYSWGWDWGPKILNAGPYLPIYLESYSTRIENVFVRSTPSNDHSTAEVSVTINLDKPVSENSLLSIIILQGNEVVLTSEVPATAQQKSQIFEATLTDPKLWWPNGHGEHPVYTVRVGLMSDQKCLLDSISTNFGVRKIEIVQRPLVDAPGTTFMFRINNRPIFTQGADWIPADNLHPTLTRKRYFDSLNMAARANVNMVRVWGGGFYETEDFWDACDELGLLVWQDYMFACGDYPINPKFLESIREEAEAQTIRFRNRASLALLCGGNEDFMFADWSTKYDHDDLEGPFDDTSFPQRKIYLKILPGVVEKFAPGTFYWPNSPFGGPSANDDTIGDIHQWEVWHAKQLPYQNYHKLSGRFVSEFGMHGYPDMRTINVFAPNPEDRHPQSQTIDCHNKGEGAEKRIARYMAENFRYTNDLEIYAYVSQLVQSEAYGYALRDWKRKFQGNGKEYCSGAIIWQLNDCYPCTSWAFIDYFLRPKPAFYTIKREFANISIGVDRTPRSRFIDEDHPRESDLPVFEIFAHNTGVESKNYMLSFKVFDLLTNRYVDGYESQSRQIKLIPGQNTELGTLKTPPDINEKSLLILRASLVDSNGMTAARIVDWPEPFRYLQWAKNTTVATKITSGQDGNSAYETLEIEANAPVKGCLMDVDDGEMPEWEDNMIDLLPGDKVTVRVKGRDGRRIKARWLNDWELKV